jgi:hypothetical protein
VDGTDIGTGVGDDKEVKPARCGNDGVGDWGEVVPLNTRVLALAGNGDPIEVLLIDVFNTPPV